MNRPLLIVDDVSVQYHGSGMRAVDGAGFSLDTGETLGIIGESGAGKSTLALALLGLVDPDAALVSGSVRLANRELLGISDKELCRIRGREAGMIFQDPVGSLDPVRRIDDQVAEAIRIHSRVRRSEALAAARAELAGVGIGADILAVSPYPHQLSGGLCQRVMIAAAVAAAPSLLIADEPTSSLDMTLQSQIITLLKEKQRLSGMALIFITHDLMLVAKIADRIAVMKDGQIVEQGQRAAVLDNPVHPYTRELLAAWPLAPRGGIAVAPA